MDANLLVLLIAGALGRDIIARHQRLRTLGPEVFKRSQEMVSRSERVLVTPNTLMAASNLLEQHGEPERFQLLTTLGILISKSCEVVLPRPKAAGHPSGAGLGLIDAELLCRASRDTPLVTLDLDPVASADRGLSTVNLSPYNRGLTSPHRTPKGGWTERNRKLGTSKLTIRTTGQVNRNHHHH